MKVHRRAWLVLLLATLGLAQGGVETVRGILTWGPGGKPVLRTSQGKLVLPEGDRATEGVLHDKRLAGADMELVGKMLPDGRFMVQPIHTRSIFVYKSGKRLMVTYWCDVCSIRTYTPGRCWCCQQETKLDLREKDDTP